MKSDIAVALIASGSSILVGLMTLIGVIITNSKSNKSIENKLEVAQAVTDTKIDELKNQVEKHNKVIERVYKLEKKEEVDQEKFKVINHRIDDLEAYKK